MNPSDLLRIIARGKGIRMKPHSRRYAPKTSADICRAALLRGPLQSVPNGWKFGRRTFTSATVNDLISRGEAVRDGNVVTRP